MPTLRSERQQQAVATVATTFVTPLITSIALAACGGGFSCIAAAHADDLPAQPAPAGFRLTNNGAGGRILDGPLAGVGSPDEAIYASARKLRSYFGDTLDLTGAVSSPDKTVTTAFFRASLHGAPVTGLSIIAFARNDGSRLAVLFDDSARFGKTLPALAARLKANPLPKGHRPTAASVGAGTAASHPTIPELTPHRAQDGTVGISIPADWRVIGLGDGRATVLGPKKELVAMNRSFSFLDPNSQRVLNAQRTAQFTHTQVVLPVSVAAYSTDIGQDYINAFVALAQSQHQADPQIHLEVNRPGGDGTAVLLGTRVEDGVERQFLGKVMAAPTGLGSWTMTLWQMSCAKEDFKQAGSVMMAIERSCTYNAERDREVKANDTEQVIAMSKSAMAASKAGYEANLAQMQRKFDSSMAAMRASEDTIEHSTASMIHIINGTSVLEWTQTGAHKTFDAGMADFIAQHDPEDYRVVPLSELRKGLDY